MISIKFPQRCVLEVSHVSRFAYLISRFLVLFGSRRGPAFWTERDMELAPTLEILETNYMGKNKIKYTRIFILVLSKCLNCARCTLK